MKKVLLLGELNQTLSSVNRHLSTRFQTQICVDILEQVKGMTKIFEPDMVVICLVGVGDLNGKVLEFFWKQYPNIPVMLIGTPEECSVYQQYYDGERFDFVTRPTTLSALMQKCLHMLKETEEVPEEVTKEVFADEKIQRRKRILVVDDSGVLLRSVKNLLDKNYEVSVATDGKLALRQAQKNMPDLILLDYEMPEWDGKKTLEEIRNNEELKNIPVVFLTGVADKEHILAVMDLKPAGYLLKPIEQNRLMDTIESVLAGTV